MKIIEPRTGFRLLDAGALWEYRELLGVLVARDIKVRYKQSVLGVAWVILRPLATMAVFTLVFGRLVKVPSDGHPYAVFVLAGLLPWTFFSHAVHASGDSLVGQAALIRKVWFPRLVVPVASAASMFLDLLISMALLLVLLPVFGIGWRPSLAAVPLLLVPIVVLALGVGILFSALTVAYRDFGSIVSIMIQVWMYLTPVIYPVSLIPERWRWAVRLNPLAAPVDAFRQAFLGGSPDFAGLAVSLGMSVAVLAAAVAYFENVERRFADII